MTLPLSRTQFIEDEQAMLAWGQAWGKKIISQKKLEMPFVFYLRGDLGSGKTTFSRGFLRGLGHAGSVKSPTYTLVEPYEFKDFTLYHFDLYRIHEPEELEWMGIRDYCQGPVILLIEWPEQGKPFIPKPNVTCHFHVEGTGRRVEVTDEPLF